MCPFLGILQHYIEFDICTIVMLEKLLGVINFEPSGSILSLVASFCGGLLTWIGVCFAFSIHSFRYHVSTFPFMCRSRGMHLFISSSYHTCISFVMNPLLYNTMYLFWLATSFGFPSFMALVWSYHWQSRYPFALVPLQEWVYSNPWYTSDIITTIALENGTHV
jgi:hypothetical protein